MKVGNPTFYCFGIRHAEVHGKYHLIDAICDRWQEYIRNEGKHGDQSFFAYRAASKLAQGLYKEAEDAVDEALRLNRGPPLAARNLDRLARAIRERDSGYEYYTTDGNAFEVLIEYR